MKNLTYPILICSLLVASIETIDAKAAERNGATPSNSTIGKREVVDAKKAPWRSIGRLNKSGKGFCTAFLVKPSWVLTAAHCLWNKDTKQFFAPKELHFLAGYQRETYLAHAQGKKLIVNPKFRTGEEPAVANMVNDWAFVQLDKPIGNDLGYFEVSQLSQAELKIIAHKDQKKDAKIYVAQAGYSKDYRYVVTANNNCRLRRVAEFKLFAHNCEIYSGDSGSPVLLISPDKIRVIAIHVGTWEDNVKRFGLAVPVASFGATGPFANR